VPRDKRGRVLCCAMDREREQVETVPVQVEVRRKRGAAIASALSDDVYNQLRTVVHALARSAAVAEHKSKEQKRKEQT